MHRRHDGRGDSLIEGITLQRLAIVRLSGISIALRLAGFNLNQRRFAMYRPVLRSTVALTAIAAAACSTGLDANTDAEVNLQLAALNSATPSASAPQRIELGGEDIRRSNRAAPCGQRGQLSCHGFLDVKIG